MNKQKTNLIFQLFAITALVIILGIILIVQQQHIFSNPTDHHAQMHSDYNVDNLALSGEIKDGKRHIKYEAYQYGFAPDPLVVMSGESIVLAVKSRDVEHGMMIPAINFNSEMPVGKYKTVKFTAPLKPGKYQIFCSVFCGSDHGSMRGSLVVLPEEMKHHGE